MFHIIVGYVALYGGHFKGNARVLNGRWVVATGLNK